MTEWRVFRGRAGLPLSLIKAEPCRCEEYSAEKKRKVKNQTQVCSMTIFIPSPIRMIPPIAVEHLFQLVPNHLPT